MVKIGIIGTGGVGVALATGWGAKGHTIVFGSRDPTSNKSKEVINKVKNCKVVSITEAIQQSDVVVLAIPWSGVQNTLQHAGDFGGKVLIDVTNPLKGLQLCLGFTTSAGEEVAKLAKNAKVVKAFNTCGWKIMVNPHFGNEKADMYIAGDDAEAKKIVCGLAADLGFEPVDVGPLSQSRLLEPMAQLWIHLAYVSNWGPNHAFKILRRSPEKK